MNEHDLLDRMAESTSWIRTEPVDPSADLARGRTRLRRRRCGIAATAVSAVAVTALGVNTLAAQLDAAPSSPPVASAGTPAASTPVSTAGRHCVGAHPYDDKGAPQAWSDDATRLMTALAKHVDPQGRYLVSSPQHIRGGCTGGYNRSVKGPWVDVQTTWRQDGGKDRVRVEVYPPGNYGDPTLGPSYAQPHLSACRQPAWPAATPYTCRWTTSADGHRVLVGSSDVKGFKSHLAGYVRADGQLVTIRIESGMHNDPDTPQPPDPVRNPDVTTERLIAAITDPAMTLR